MDKRPRFDLCAGPLSRINPEQLAMCLDYLCDASELLRIVSSATVFDNACEFVSHVRLERSHVASGYVWRRFSHAEHVKVLLPCGSLELLAGYLSSPAVLKLLAEFKGMKSVVDVPSMRRASGKMRS